MLLLQAFLLMHVHTLFLQNANSTAPDGWGRVSYEQKGECFFIPFGSEDVDGDISLDTGDEVYFYIATDKRYNPQTAMLCVLLELCCLLVEKWPFGASADATQLFVPFHMECAFGTEDTK